MQLREPKSLGMLDHHQRSIGHINAHFNHRGADQQLHLAADKKLHHRLFLGGRHARMQQTNQNAGKCGAELLVRLRGIAQIQHF